MKRALTPMRNVVRHEMQTTVHEESKKKTRQDYGTNGFKVCETIVRTTVCRPAALLDCGHWRKYSGTGPDLTTAKRLQCWECEEAATGEPGA